MHYSMITRRSALGCGLASVSYALLGARDTSAANDIHDRLQIEAELRVTLQRQVEKILRRSEERYGVEYTPEEREKAVEQMWAVAKSILDRETSPVK